MTLAEALWLVSTSIAIAGYASVGTLSRHEAAALTAAGVRHTLIIVVAGAAALFLVAPYLIEFLFGANTAPRPPRCACSVSARRCSPRNPSSPTTSPSKWAAASLSMAIAATSCLINVVVSVHPDPALSGSSAAPGPRRDQLRRRGRPLRRHLPRELRRAPERPLAHPRADIEAYLRSPGACRTGAWRPRNEQPGRVNRIAVIGLPFFAERAAAGLPRRGLDAIYVPRARALAPRDGPARLGPPPGAPRLLRWLQPGEAFPADVLVWLRRRVLMHWVGSDVLAAQQPTPAS